MADKRRRKSLSLFWPKAEQPSQSGTPSSPVEKRTEELYAPSPVDSEHPSPKLRPRTLQKPNRTSVFGSLRSLHSLDEDEKAALTRSDSKASSLHEDGEMNIKALLGNTVLHHGEVQTTASSVFRKKSQYLVLTDTHLVRFKNQAKAGEMFASIPTTISRTSSRISSIGSSHDLQFSAYQDVPLGIPLEQIVAIYKLDDGRPFFTVEVSYLDERAKKGSAVQLVLNEPREAEQWTHSIRAASAQARTPENQAFHKSTLEHIARVLERDRDYDPDHFRMFKVAQRAASRNTSRSSAEDLSKLSSTVCYLAIGLHKVHLVPLPRASNRSSSTSLNEVDAPTSFGITMLTAVKSQAEEDAFQLVFKSPLRSPYAVSLASTNANDIALWLRYTAEYLRPEWVRQPFVFDVPQELEDQMNPPTFIQEDYKCFDRTLIAYCAAYDVDTSRICYTVNPNCEDTPAFQLLPPTDGNTYSAMELLAVLRALRYNESFVTLSFANINLWPLRYLYDAYATDIDSQCTRSGSVVNLPGHYELPVLCQEIRALALKSRRLRRFDFGHAFPILPQHDGERASCGIPEALAPLCKKSLTNVDWIVLNGVQLSDTDVNFLVDAASERACHLRALEIGECGLSVHDVDVLLSTLAVQENTMEVINISGAQGRFSPEIFQREIGVFRHIRRLNLTRVQKTAGNESLVAPETLMAWRLEALYLSQTTLNEQTVDSISSYLASSRSDILRELHVDQCGLSGRDLAVFFQSMTREPGQARQMHVSASENRLKVGRSALVDTISKGYGPSSLTMRMMDFEKEHHFRELILALTANTTLRSLDISRASLPYDASEETCEALRGMFASNTTLEELDISGELAHLDATQFGIGLNNALRGLEKNKRLKLLRIEHQRLGLQGANMLAGVLEANDTLLEIHCEHNDINLQSFTVLVNALENNKVLQYLPVLDDDRGRSLDKVRKEFDLAEKADGPKTPKAGAAIKRSLTGVLPGRAHRGHRPSSSVSSTISFTDNDVMAVLRALDERWDTQISRLHKYLNRNYCLANGIRWEDDQHDEEVIGKHTGTEDSLYKMLESIKLDRTPTAKRPSPLDFLDEKLAERSPLVFQLPEE